MWYFAYGSNLNQQDLDRWCDRHGRPFLNLRAKPWRRAALKDFGLAFNCYSRSQRCGPASIRPSPGEYVRGVAFEITQEEFRQIAQKEGAPETYVEKHISLTLEDNTAVPAVTFRCRPGTERPDRRPCKDYLRIIIEGAKQYDLHPDWIKKLEEAPTKG